MNSRKQTMVKHSSSNPTAARVQALIAFVGLSIGTTLTGCTALTQPINGVPAGRLPPQFFNGERDGLVPIDVSLLSQETPRNYRLGAGDVLGIVVPTILPYAEPDTVPALPPVNFPDADSDLPPSTGFPTTVLEDGTISLPLVDPIVVDGLTTDQVREKIRAAYLDAKILREDEQKKITPIVTIIQKRQISIVVIRQDQSQGNQALSNQQQQGLGRGGVRGVDYSSEGNVIKLDAFKNDILHALMQTGGLPGVTAKNQVKILRSKNRDRQARLDFIRNYGQIVANHCDPCSCPPPMPEDPAILTIPMRLPPGVVPSIQPSDVVLEEGDIVLIETRDTEFFYTGGLLPGGQWPLPRDYDLDALGAMAISGYGVGNQSQQRGGLAGIGGAAQVVPPGRLYVIRKTPCKGQLAIEVDLTKAINDPRQRPIIQPGDTLILQYKPCEEAINFGVGTFFTFGIRELFSGN